MLKRVGQSRHPCRTKCCSEPVFYAAVEEDGTSGLVMKVFDDSDKVCTDVVLLHGCPESGMPNLVEGPLEVHEDMTGVLPAPKTLPTDDLWVEDLLCGAPACSEAHLLPSDDPARLWLQSVQYDLQHDSA